MIVGSVRPGRGGRRAARARPGHAERHAVYSSIVGSALAALALIVGVRQLPAARLPEVDFDVRPGGPGPGSWPPRPIGRGRATAAVARGRRRRGHGARRPGRPRRCGLDRPRGRAGRAGRRASGTAAAVGRLATEVVVVDGRPRYHLEGCLHLLGLDGARLPALEAVELGFTPCAHVYAGHRPARDRGQRRAPSAGSARLLGCGPMVEWCMSLGEVTVAVRVRPRASRTAVGGAPRGSARAGDRGRGQGTRRRRPGYRRPRWTPWPRRWASVAARSGCAPVSAAGTSCSRSIDPPADLMERLRALRGSEVA